MLFEYWASQFASSTALMDPILQNFRHMSLSLKKEKPAKHFSKENKKWFVLQTTSPICLSDILIDITCNPLHNQGHVPNFSLKHYTQTIWASFILWMSVLAILDQNSIVNS